MHGGAVMGWADTMGGMTASAAVKDGERTATIESKTNFFAPIPKGDTAHAVCTPLHSGRSTIVLQTNITRGDGKLAAIVTQTPIVLPAKAAAESLLHRALMVRDPRASEQRFGGMVLKARAPHHEGGSQIMPTIAMNHSARQFGRALPSTHLSATSPPLARARAVGAAGRCGARVDSTHRNGL